MSVRWTEERPVHRARSCPRRKRASLGPEATGRGREGRRGLEGLFRASWCSLNSMDHPAAGALFVWSREDRSDRTSLGMTPTPTPQTRK